jgi:undecaprenyl pyrophosphate phosphatase UppP
LTELFPVSGSAHLVILQSFLPDFHQPGMAFKQIPSGEIWLYFVGFICAALAGLLSLKLFFLVIREPRLKFFTYYCWLFELFTLLVKSPFF